VPALLRALVACGWFGIQTWIGGWAIFVTDNLDNGAGYSSAYSETKAFNVILEGIESDLLPYLLEKRHSLSCSNSCYHCLRNYYNRSAHQYLDWRLGIDLLFFLKDPKYVFSLHSPWWKSYISHTFFQKLQQITRIQWTLKATSIGIAFVDNNKGHAIIPTHPFVVIDHRTFDDVHQTFKSETAVSTNRFLNVFEFERKPVTALQQMPVKT